MKYVYFQVNPFIPNGISLYYQVGQPVSVFRVVGGIFHFYSNLDRTTYKQTVETLIRRHKMRRLIWVFNVCLSHKKDARLKGAKWSIVLERSKINQENQT